MLFYAEGMIFRGQGSYAWAFSVRFMRSRIVGPLVSRRYKEDTVTVTKTV